MKSLTRGVIHPMTLLIFILICQNTYRALYPMGVPQAAAGAASVVAALGTPLRILLKALHIAREGHEFLKNIHDCVYCITEADTSTTESSFHKKIKKCCTQLKPLYDFWCSSHARVRERKEREEDEKLQKDESLRLAQQQAIAKAVHLLLVSFSPTVHVCDRIAALFVLNRVKLLGVQARIFGECLAVINCHHFNSDGSLKGYDPSVDDNKKPHRIQKLIAFLKAMVRSKEDYINYLKKGIELGISSLMGHYQEDQLVAGQPNSGQYSWNHTMELLKTGTGIDFSSLLKVDSYTILNNRANVDFLKVIHYCNHDYLPAQFEVARELIQRHRSKHQGVLCKQYRDMERYYYDACEKWKRDHLEI